MAKKKDYESINILPKAIKTHNDDRTWTRRENQIKVGGGIKVSQERWDEIFKNKEVKGEKIQKKSVRKTPER